MNLKNLMDEAATVLATITGLRVTAWPPGSVVPPAGIVSYPNRIEYQTTYGRGVNVIRGLPFVLVVGKATERSARDTASAWTAGSGAASVVAAMEAHSWTSCDDLTVTAADFDVVTIAGVDYLAAMFEADAIGPGGV
jgi:hypothetical protein